MSLLERQLDALLEPLPSSDDVDPETEREVDRQRVGEALRVLGRGCPERASGTATKPQISTEMWARCAEACVRVGSIKDASDCLRSFFTAQPPTNQFLARAYLCQASVEHERIRQGKLRGDEAAAQCLHAISFVVRGLEVATSDVGAGLGAPDPKLYSFLVVNASTVWWKVSRPLRVHVLMAKLVPSLERLLQALANADKSMEAKDPAWMAQLYICMGQCQMDAGDAAKAGQVATDALKLADSAGLVDHMERAYRLQIHAGQKSVAPPKPFLKVAGLLQEVASGITAPVSVSGVLMEALKDSHADPVLAGALAANPDDSKQALVVANEEDEKLKAKPSQECLDLVAEIGCAAIHTGLPSVCAIAEACVLRASLAKSLRSRVLCQYVSAGLAIHGLGDESERYTRRMVAVRLDVLSQLERALQSAERLPDKDLALVQEGCVLVWNVALPLLQPNLRVQPMVQRALFRACKVLDDRDSYLHELRATLQLELARAAIDDDFVSRAQSCVDKALELNYIDQDQEQTGRDRPMDDRLLPLKQALSLKTDIYNDPTTDGERVSLLLENARDSKGLQAAEAKKSFLTRAANLLNQIDTPAEDAEYFRLWVDLTKQAWAGKLIDLAEMGCEKVLPSSWDPVRARERVIWSVQLYFIRGEVAVMRLREAGLELAASGGAESEQNRLVATANNSFLAASKLGLDLQESWIVVNAVTYTYNYYLPLLRQRRYAEVKEQLTWCFDDLKAINVDEPVLLCAVADALACALEHTFLLDNRPGGGDAPEGAELPTYDALQKLDITSANAEELTMATDVCEFVCQDHEERRAKPTAAQQRDLIATMRRVQKWRAANPTPLPSNHAQVFMLLNTCTEKLASGKQHEAAADVQEAFSIMRDENTEHSTELWSRLAFAALDSGLYSDAVQCAEKCESAIPTGALGVAGQAYGKNPNNWVNWRWFSVAESTHGQALMKMLDIKRQDKSDLDKIKQSAMEHFTLAAQYGALARYAPLVEAPARHFWNASLDFQKNEVTRKVLNDQRKMLRKILDAMQDCTGPIATKVKVRMYEALLTCYRDAQNWKEGLTLTDEAFKNVPATNHKSLWDERVIFMTKMGMNLLGAMLKVKEMYSERMLARVWVSVARVATNRVEQFQAYTSAIGALHKTPWEAVDYSIEFAEWLFCNDFPIADAEDQLLSVCDYLLGIASPEGDGTIQTSRSGDSLGSRSMKSGMGATNTARSTAASTAASIAQSQVSKGAPRPKSLDVGHYEIMMRVYVMLASITVNRDKQTEYCMLAAEQVVNIWQHLSEYTSEAETDGAGVPQHAAGWTTFSISDELRTCISSAAAGTAPNRTTLPRPELTWDYCVKLVTMLNERGYAVQSLPVLGLLEVLSADVLVCRQGKLLQAWVHLRTGSILESLELSQAARDRQQRASNVSDNFSVDEILMKECQDEMKQRTELKHQLSSNAGAGASGSTTAPTKLLRPMSDRIVWVLLSSALLEVGYLKDAKLLLELALEQANVFDDDECRSRCLHLLARVAFWEENVANAIKLELEAQEYDGDLDLWCDSIAAVVDYTEYSGDQRSCKRCLDQAIESLHQIAAARASSAAMAKFYRARFMHRKAKVLAGIKASPGSAFGTPVLNAPPGDCDAAVALLRETISEIDLCGVDIAVVDMHRDLVYLLRRKAHGEAETSAINAQSVFEECTASLEAAAKVVKHVLLTSSSAVSDSFRVVQKRTLAALYLARSEIDLDLAYLQQHVLAERESAKVIEFNRTEHGDTEMMTRWMKEQDHLTQVEPLPAGGMAHDAASILHLQAALNLDSGAATEARVSLGMGKALRFQAKEQQDFKSAIETLNRCVQQAREQHEDILVADASAEILQCYLTMHSSPHMPAVERADRPEMLWSLSAFQGCTASQQLRQRYVWASPLSSPEIFALRLRDELAARLQPPSRALSERLATIEGFLDKSEAFNTLRSATAASLDETRELLPDKMKVIILQHTKDGRQLFCGSLSKDTISSEPPEPSVDADGEEDDTQLPVCAIDVDPRALADLQEESSKFSKAASTYIASIGKASTQPSAELGTRNPRFNSAEEVAVGWRTHCQHLANYLQPALDAVVPANFVGEGEQLVLLLDDSLMTLPVDAMASFATAESVARDFSLALFTYRLRAAASVGSGTALIGKADVAYVVDPLDEGYAANVDVKKEWTGVVGSDHVPSIAEYKQLLHGSSAFLYFGAGSTQAVVDPAALATTPISAHAVLLFDRHLTELASRMQAERDRRTTALEKWLDTPLMTVSLLSVQGAKSVVCNLRTTRLECNAAMAREVLIGLEGSKSLGHALCQARKEWVTATQPIDGEEVQTGNIAQALEGHAAYNTIVVGLPHISM